MAIRFVSLDLGTVSYIAMNIASWTDMIIFNQKYILLFMKESLHLLATTLFKTILANDMCCRSFLDRKMILTDATLDLLENGNQVGALGWLMYHFFNVLKIADIILESPDHIVVSKKFCSLHDCMVGEAELSSPSGKAFWNRTSPRSRSIARWRMAQIWGCCLRRGTLSPTM